MMNEIQDYCLYSGALAYVDMVRDLRFRYLGVVPLWENKEEAWDWFSEKFLDEPSDADQAYFYEGWNKAQDVERPS